MAKKNKRYLDLITKNTSSRLQKMNLMDNFYETMADSYSIGDPNSKGVSQQLKNRGELLADGVTPPWLAPTQGQRRLKTRGDMMDELLPITDFTSSTGTKQSSSKDGFPLTTGDVIGMVSTVGGAISEISNTISAAKATKPEVNTFKGFNEKALAKNRQAQVQSQENKAVKKRAAERELKLSRNTLKKNLRGKASGINTLRNFDLGANFQTDEALIGASNEIESIFGNQMLQLLTQEQGLLSQQDQMEMSAEERKNERVQQNRDNYYTNMATNIAGLSEAGQKLGADLNQSKYRQDFLNILPLTNAWGVGVEYENGINGVPSLYSRKRNTSIVEE